VLNVRGADVVGQALPSPGAVSRLQVARGLRLLSTSSVGLKVLAVFFCAGACLAQQYELGGAFGYGVYTDGSVISPGGTATAGIRNRFATGVVVLRNLFEHVSGEMRYLYHDGDPFFPRAPSEAISRASRTAFHYDVLFQARGRRRAYAPTWRWESARNTT